MVPLLATLVVLFIPGFASAHGLGVQVKQWEGIVRVTAYFDTDDPADDCIVTVTDAEGRVIATGKTDANGTFTFPKPASGEYRIVADAGAGHRAQATLVSSTVMDSGAETTTGPRTGFGKWIASAAGLAAITLGTIVWRRTRPAGTVSP